MNRSILLIAGVCLLATLGYAILFSSRSHEERIRGLLENATQSFNETYLAGCLAAFHDDYRGGVPGSVGVTRANLANALRYVFMRFVKSESKEFRLRVEMPSDDLVIELSADELARESPESGGADDEVARTASAQFTLRLFRLVGEDWRNIWELAVEADLRLVEGEWGIHRSKHRTVSGRQPR